MVIFICFLHRNNETERKITSSKTSDLIYDVIRTKTFEETYFPFYFIVSKTEYSLKRCLIMMLYSDAINTITEIKVALKICEKRKII